LYDLLKPHVREVVVCNPRRNALLKEGSKSDKVDGGATLNLETLQALDHGIEIERGGHMAEADAGAICKTPEEMMVPRGLIALQMGILHCG
jgi:hypothetical protein